MAEPKSSSVIIIKKQDAHGGGHHGGSWKVAYADFVTAMMAFFLLMWLLNMTTKEQKAALADYFEQYSIFEQSGSSMLPGQMGVLRDAVVRPPAGASPNGTLDGLLLANQTNGTVGENGTGGVGNLAHFGANESLPNGVPEGMENGAFPIGAPRQASRSELLFVLDAVLQDRLAGMKEQVVVSQDGEGVRIELMDNMGRPLFELGKDAPTPRGREAIAGITQALDGVTNPIVIEGHTDSLAYAKGRNGYGNWELSAERAMAVRRLMVENGLDQRRLQRVSGLADTVPLLPNAPEDARNRRISIFVTATQSTSGDR